MELCILAKIVLVLAIVSLVFNVCVFGLTIGFLVDALFMTLMIFITNRYCDSWIAKVIVVYAIISTLLYSSICSSKLNLYQQIVEDTKQLRETTKR